jgi:ectoine hydroxylase-related dioxygenase (phytanoyl-CoA dioxygenase family)
MTMAEALAELGADGPPPADVAKALDEQGYAVLPGRLSMDEVTRRREHLDRLAQREETEGGSVVREPGLAQRIDDVIDKDDLFDDCVLDTALLQAVHHVLGEFRFGSMVSRAALPGSGHQALHADYQGTVERGDWRMVNSALLLDDFTELTGATRIVPGSHLSGDRPENVMDDPKEPHPDQKLVIAPAGSRMLFNAHAWHSGSLNKSDGLRRGVFTTFMRRDEPVQTDQIHTLSPATLARLSPAAQFIVVG